MVFCVYDIWRYVDSAYTYTALISDVCNRFPSHNKLMDFLKAALEAMRSALKALAVLMETVSTAFHARIKQIFSSALTIVKQVSQIFFSLWKGHKGVCAICPAIVSATVSAGVAVCKVACRNPISTAVVIGVVAVGAVAFFYHRWHDGIFFAQF